MSYPSKFASTTALILLVCCGGDLTSSPTRNDKNPPTLIQRPGLITYHELDGHTITVSDQIFFTDNVQTIGSPQIQRSEVVLQKDIDELDRGLAGYFPDIWRLRIKTRLVADKDAYKEAVVPGTGPKIYPSSVVVEKKTKLKIVGFTLGPEIAIDKPSITLNLVDALEKSFTLEVMYEAFMHDKKDTAVAVGLTEYNGQRPAQVAYNVQQVLKFAPYRLGVYTDNRRSDPDLFNFVVRQRLKKPVRFKFTRERSLPIRKYGDEYLLCDKISIQYSDWDHPSVEDVLTNPDETYAFQDTRGQLIELTSNQEPNFIVNLGRESSWFSFWRRPYESEEDLRQSLRICPDIELLE